MGVCVFACVCVCACASGEKSGGVGQVEGGGMLKVSVDDLHAPLSRLLGRKK